MTVNRPLLLSLFAALVVSSCGCSISTVEDDPAPVGGSSTLVAAGLRFSDSTRYAVQKKLVAFEDGTLLAVFHDGLAEQPLYLRPVLASLSSDAGATWTDPVQVTPSGFIHVEFAAVAAHGTRAALAFTGQNDPVRGTGIFVTEGQLDGLQISWDDPVEITPQAHAVDFKFPSVLFDPAGHLHVLCRADVPYDDACDDLEEDCGHELRHVFYLTDETGEWTFLTISDRWTSTVPDLDIDPDGGEDGAAGRGRLWAVWHNEERPAEPIGCMVADVSLWSLDLDTQEATLSFVPGSWQGEECDDTVKSALLPSISVDTAGLPHAVWSHADADYDQTAYYAHANHDGSWTSPELVSEEALRYGAVLAVVGDQPVVYSARAGTADGEVFAFSRSDGAWQSTSLVQSPTSAFNWVTPSLRPVADGQHGVLFGLVTDTDFDGAVYFALGP